MSPSALGQTRWIVPLLVAGVLLLGLLPMPTQSQPQAQPLVLTLQAPATFVLDGKNLINATMRNDGASPLAVKAKVTLTDGTRSRVFSGVGGMADGESFQLNPGDDPEELQFEWDGRNTANAAFQGSVTVTFEAQEASGVFTRATQVGPNAIQEHNMVVKTKQPAADARMDAGKTWEGYFGITVENLGKVASAVRLQICDETDENGIEIDDAGCGGPGANYSQCGDLQTPDDDHDQEWKFEFTEAGSGLTTTTLPEPTANGGMTELSVGGMTAISVKVTAPAHSPPGAQGCADLWVGNDLTFSQEPHGTQASPRSYVKLLSPKLRTSGDLDIVISPPADIMPGTAGLVTVTVRNDQNVDESVELQVQDLAGGPPVGGQSITFVSPPGVDSATQAIPQKETRQFTFNVVVPDIPSLSAPGSDGHEADEAYLYEAVVLAPAREKEYTEQFRVTVKQVPRGLATPQSHQPTVRPGSDFTVPWNICNDGNVLDSYTLTPLNVPSSWGPDPAILTGNLAPQACSQHQWKMRVPGDAPKGPQSLSFRLTSHKYAATAVLPNPDIVWFSIDETPFPRITVDAVTPPATGSLVVTKPTGPGETQTFTLHLANIGTTVGAFSLTPVLTTTPTTGWTMSRQEGQSPSSVWPWQGSIPAGTSRDIVVSVTAPAVVQRDHSFEAVFSLSVDNANPVLVKTATLKVAPPFADLSLAALPAPLLFKDFPTNITLEVRNEGAAPTQHETELIVRFFDATTENQQGPTYKVKVPTLDYQPGKNTHTFKVAVPTAGFSGGLSVVASMIDPDDPDPNADPIMLPETTLTVTRFAYDIQKPLAIHAKPGELVALDGKSAVRVKNLGDVHDIVITAQLKPDWRPLAPVQLTLDGTKELSYKFLVPDEPQVETATLTIRVGHATAGVSTSAILKILIDDGAGPVLNSLTFNPTAAIGEPIEFVANVTDAVGIHEVRLYTVDPVGGVSFVKMAPTKDPNLYRYEESFAAAGQYSVYLWARDTSSRQNVADSAEAAQTLLVKPTTGPTLRLASPTQIRPGTPLVFTAFGNVPLREAFYNLGQGNVKLASINPIQLQTDGLPDGYYNVSVAAEDTLGQTTTFVTSVLVDGTGPKFGKIALWPEKPILGDLVEVSVNVTDALPIRSVVLRISGVNGVAEDLPLNATESAYVGSFVYAAGATNVQLLAEDAVGNRGFAERLVVDAPAGKASPAIPLAPILFLLLLAVLAKRGRREA